MTALAALWSHDGEPAAARCARMLEAQAMYGPDGAAQADDGAVSLGRRLFKLTTEDEFDRAPVGSDDKTRWMVADVRIDNREELIAALGLDGDALSDPALLMQAFDRWGITGLGRVVGPFALILWDATTNRLMLARDPMGERPLHYHQGDGFVAVASMPKGIHALPGVPYAADAASAADFLALMPETGAESFFVGIARVLPGHVVTIDPDGLSSARFWTWPTDILTLSRDEDYVMAMRTAFDRAVARRLRIAGGPIATQLSAGLDSSGVTATAARLLAPSRLFAFTAVPAIDTPVPGNAIANEGPLAAATAALYPNIEHIRIATPDTSPLSLFDRQFQLFERPMLNPSNAIWTEAIMEAARLRGARVMLTGQMGNLTFSHAGWQYLPQLFGRARLVALSRLAWRMARRGTRWTSIGASTLGPFLPRTWWTWLSARFSIGAPLTTYSAIREHAVADEGIDARAAARGLDLSYRPWRDGQAMRMWVLSRVDMGVYNKGILAGWGIDMRDPTADRDLVALCLRSPERQYILGGVTRSLARRMLADRLPAAVTGEQRRGYQASDWHVALSAARGQIAAELDSFDRSPVAARLIDTDRLRAALEDWPDGGWHHRDRIDRYHLAMSRGLAAGHFLRKVARTN